MGNKNTLYGDFGDEHPQLHRSVARKGLGCEGSVESLQQAFDEALNCKSLG